MLLMVVAGHEKSYCEGTPRPALCFSVTGAEKCLLLSRKAGWGQARRHGRILGIQGKCRALVGREVQTGIYGHGSGVYEQEIAAWTPDASETRSSGTGLGLDQVTPGQLSHFPTSIR